MSYVFGYWVAGLIAEAEPLLQLEVEALAQRPLSGYKPHFISLLRSGAVWFVAIIWF